MKHQAHSTTRPCSTRCASEVAAARRLLREIADDFSPGRFRQQSRRRGHGAHRSDRRERLDIEIFSLDTGRLPLETYELIAEVKKHYGLALRLYYPRHDLVEAWTREHGINAFYESVELRKGCCFVRKVEPLQRALAGRKAWITGMRAQQSATRDGLPLRSFDAANGGLEKVQPARRLERTRSLGLPQAAPGALQRPARPVLPEHRLRAVHPRDHARRRRPRRPLVVGKSRIEGMRLAPQARLKPDRQTTR
jgi:hypothetical protein